MINLRSFVTPLLILHYFEIFFSCTAFSLVSSVQLYQNQYGAWSMFTWIFCFMVTILNIVLEQTGFSNKVPISWEYFILAFCMLALLMFFTTSIMYPLAFLKGSCSQHSCACGDTATTMSILCFFAYAIELGLARSKSNENSGFLSTIPGLIKVFEAFIACVIFSLLPPVSFSPYLQGCVALYSICFIIITLIIILAIGRLLPRLPINFGKILMGYNILSEIAYTTAAYLWTFYFFKAFPIRDQCRSGWVCKWDIGVGITSLTLINLVVYIIDTLYYFRSFIIIVTNNHGKTTNYGAP